MSQSPKNDSDQLSKESQILKTRLVEFESSLEEFNNQLGPELALLERWESASESDGDDEDTLVGQEEEVFEINSIEDCYRLVNEEAKQEYNEGMDEMKATWSDLRKQFLDKLEEQGDESGSNVVQSPQQNERPVASPENSDQFVQVLKSNSRGNKNSTINPAPVPSSSSSSGGQKRVTRSTTAIFKQRESIASLEGSKQFVQGLKSNPKKNLQSTMITAPSPSSVSSRPPPKRSSDKNNSSILLMPPPQTEKPISSLESSTKFAQGLKSSKKRNLNSTMNSDVNVPSSSSATRCKKSSEGRKKKKNVEPLKIVEEPDTNESKTLVEAAVEGSIATPENSLQFLLDLEFNPKRNLQSTMISTSSSNPPRRSSRKRNGSVVVYQPANGQAIASLENSVQFVQDLELNPKKNLHSSINK